MIKWQEIFSKNGLPWQDAAELAAPVAVSGLPEL